MTQKFTFIPQTQREEQIVNQLGPTNWEILPHNHINPDKCLITKHSHIRAVNKSQLKETVT